MTHTETHKITLAKLAMRKLQTKVLEDNMTGLISATLNASIRVRGWEMVRDDEETGQGWAVESTLTEDANYRYTLNFLLIFTRDDDKTPEPTELPAILRQLATKGRNPAYGRNWEIATVDGEPYEAPEEEAEDLNKFIEYANAEIPEGWEESFAHLFNLDAHISIVKKALDAGIMSEWRNRFHCALIGPPGCGKSDIAGTFKDLIGQDAVWALDGTAITSAGVIKELAERQILPRLVVIEEIEKANESALSFLLGLMDTRAEIRKTTARGSIQRDTRCFVIATVNDYKKFKTIASGALASRFANRVFFSRPDRDVLTQILIREIAKDGGSTEWIDPTLDYCDTHKITDPRRVISICLTGREDLVSGKFQEMLEATNADVYEEGDEE